MKKQLTENGQKPESVDHCLQRVIDDTHDYI